MPGPTAVAASLLMGFNGYGLSLTLFVVGLRRLGTARAAAYFSVAPALGVAISLVLWPESPSVPFRCAAPMMGVGIWTHIHERYEHEHGHDVPDRTHALCPFLAGQVPA